MTRHRCLNVSVFFLFFCRLFVHVRNRLLAFALASWDRERARSNNSLNHAGHWACFNYVFLCSEQRARVDRRVRCVLVLCRRQLRWISQCILLAE